MSPSPRFTLLPQRRSPLVWGVVNVTPDSFSDGGRWLSPQDAVRHGLSLHEAGADVLDIGGESTRPGAVRPSVSLERERVLPVVEALAAAGAVVSIDTMRAEVAEAAIDAGATIVNDVSGGLADPEMLSLVATRGVGYVAMHWRGHSTEMQQLAHYDDVVTEVRAELSDRIEAALAAGISPDRLAIDPGLGFAKTADHNWALLRSLDVLHDLGCPLLLGASRKSFLGALLADRDGTPRPVDERESAHLAVVTLSALHDVWSIRTHDVRATVDALRAVCRWQDRADAGSRPA